MPPSPYVIGQWVRGENFYGRRELIEQVLRGPRNWLWLLGTRRMGKTSLLKQVEQAALDDSELKYLPVFWDFQGADTLEELKGTFDDALLDVEDRLENLGIDPARLEDMDVFEALRRLRRQLRPHGVRLLLLCDEVEELLALDRQDPTVLRKLRRMMQSQEGVRSVLASTIKLWALAKQETETSPFLHGFLPPMYIQRLAAEESRELIRQTHLDSDARPAINDDAVEKIRIHCDDHPYLLQLVCTRYLERGDLDEAIQEVASDPMVSYFFSVDYQMLSPAERNIIRIIAARSESSSETIQEQLRLKDNQLRGRLDRLEHLGFIRYGKGRRYELRNHFFRRWFLEQADEPLSSETGRQVEFDSGNAISLSPRPDGAAEDATVTETERFEILDGRYELRDLVGQGAAGMVYRSFDRLLRVEVAVKILKPQYSVSAEAFERFRQEIVLARDVSHPNILRIYHLGEQGDRRYLTMQWVHGCDLSQMLQREGALPLERARDIGLKLSSALDALHSHNVLHRDIKPKNVLIEAASGEPLLTDFGLARLLTGSQLTSAGVFLGTPEYASPEQAQLLPLDHRADLYALGLILFELATGRRPFERGSRREVLERHRSEAAPSPGRFRPELPDEYCRIVLRCLEKEPPRRYASAAELHDALERLEVAAT